MVAGTGEDPLGPSFMEKVPEELHDMLSAGLSIAVKRLLKNYMIPIPSQIDATMGSEDEYDVMGDRLWNYGLCEPAPQMKRFIRHNQMRQNIRERDMTSAPSGYGRWISVKLAHRIFEQEVYDFGLSIGLSKKQATEHVIEARKRSSKHNVDMLELGDYESNECEDLSDFLKTYREPEVPNLVYLSDHEMENAEDFLARIKSKAAMRAADHTKKEKTARKESKKARTKAGRQAQKEAWRQVEQTKSQKSTDPQAGLVPKEQQASASNPERPAQVEPIEDQGKPLKRKKKGRKRKSKPELPIQFEVPSEENVKHKKSRVGSDVQDAVSKKAKIKRDVGPQHSPFFQRSSNPKLTTKDAAKKAEQMRDFQSPMIQ